MLTYVVQTAVPNLRTAQLAIVLYWISALPVVHRAKNAYRGPVSNWFSERGVLRLGSSSMPKRVDDLILMSCIKIFS
jgi:hypothetical protein